MSGKDELPPIIVKKIKKVAGGHHGGAWKVAYADFVTAMMAFFLLLWLLNVSTDEALNTISSYFDPSDPKIADIRSGAGGLMGGLSVSKEGAMVTNVQPLSAPLPTGRAGQGESSDDQGQKSKSKADLKKLEEELRKKEAANFKAAKESLEKALRENPALQALAKNLKIDVTPEGLRIQIVDQDGKPMFPSGSADMFDKTKELLAAVADIALSMPNAISVRGHTDSYQYAPGATYTNWELSADRANASRRVLLENHIPESRVSDVVGKADTEPLVPENPLDAQNRRISIILLNETVEHAAARGAFGDSEESDESTDDSFDFDEDVEDYIPAPAEPDDDFKRTPGAVFFP